MRKFLTIAICSILTSACLSHARLDEPYAKNNIQRSYMGNKYSFVQRSSLKGFIVKTQNVIQRSYKLREQRVAMLGNPMAQVRSFVREIHRQRKVSPTKDVVLVGGANRIKLYKDRSYDIVGAVKTSDKVNGQVYDVIRATPVDGVLFDLNGKIQRQVIRLDENVPVPLTYDFMARPKNVRIKPAEKDRIVNKPVNFEFELRFDGMKGDLFFITYMRFNPQKGKNAGFFETFTYKKGAKIINLAGLSIKVLSVSREKIDFVIIDDAGISKRAEEVLEKKPLLSKNNQHKNILRARKRGYVADKYKPAYPYMKLPAPPTQRKPVASPVECCINFDNRR